MALHLKEAKLLCADLVGQLLLGYLFVHAFQSKKGVIRMAEKSAIQRIKDFRGTGEGKSCGRRVERAGPQLHADRRKASQG
jgi:hypothetical protein